MNERKEIQEDTLTSATTIRTPLGLSGVLVWGHRSPLELALGNAPQREFHHVTLKRIEVAQILTRGIMSSLEPPPLWPQVLAVDSEEYMYRINGIP